VVNSGIGPKKIGARIIYVQPPLDRLFN
jgi:hypothetical protein